MFHQLLKSLQPDGANYIFRNSRLLVGWHVLKAGTTEVWLAHILPSHATGGDSGSEAKQWRFYTSADGSDPLMNMNMNQLHPALLVHFFGKTNEEFFRQSRNDMVRFMVGRHADVVNG